MYYNDFQVVMQEVPGEISLCYSISGCPLRCNGCHSPFLWKEGNGSTLTMENFTHTLKRYSSLATCVLFMGGEWHSQELTQMLKIAKGQGFKTCLYTGAESVESQIMAELTWIKTGKWDHSLGGLDEKKTNQRFIEVKTKKVQNDLFIKSHI